MTSTPAAERQFTVVLRGPSAVIFQEGVANAFRVAAFPTPVGPVTIQLSTRYLNRGENVVVPGHLWIEVRGNGRDLESCIGPFANAGLALLPFLALSANAAISEPDFELGFDSTPGARERAFFQSFVEPESSALRPARHIRLDSTVALLEALHRSPHFDRLRRAANHYRLALGNWRMGHDTLAAAHLWMAVEALTKAMVREKCAGLGAESESRLAAQLQVDKRHLDAAVRKRFILKGDAECYRMAKKASDGFEHGFLEFDEVREHASVVRDRLSTYVRLAIFDLARFEGEHRQVLCATPFDQPLGHFAYAQYLRGKLVSPTDELAAPGNAYPFMRWHSTVKRSLVTSDGRREIEPEVSITPEFADGVSIKLERYEVWQQQ